jgi:hypothetical protein
MLRQVREQTTRVRARIDTLAGDEPACFDSPAHWRDWLFAASQGPDGLTGGPVLRVVPMQRTRHGTRTTVLSPDIDYCADCTKAYRARMAAESRCWPTAAQIERDAADARIAA